MANKQYEFLTKHNEAWQRRNLSRLLAVTVGVLALIKIVFG